MFYDALILIIIAPALGLLLANIANELLFKRWKASRIKKLHEIENRVKEVRGYVVLEIQRADRHVEALNRVKWILDKADEQNRKVAITVRLYDEPDFFDGEHEENGSGFDLSPDNT